MDLQACLPAVLAAIYNFICDLNPINLNDFEEALDIEPGWCSGDLADEVLQHAEREKADRRCDEVADAMWVQYQQHLARGYQHDEMVFD